MGISLPDPLAVSFPPCFRSRYFATIFVSLAHVKRLPAFALPRPPCSQSGANPRLMMVHPSPRPSTAGKFHPSRQALGHRGSGGEEVAVWHFGSAAERARAGIAGRHAPLVRARRRRIISRASPARLPSPRPRTCQVCNSAVGSERDGGHRLPRVALRVALDAGSADGGSSSALQLHAVTRQLANAPTPCYVRPSTLPLARVGRDGPEAAESLCATADRWPDTRTVASMSDTTVLDRNMKHRSEVSLGCGTAVKCAEMCGSLRSAARLVPKGEMLPWWAAWKQEQKKKMLETDAIGAASRLCRAGASHTCT